MCGIVGYKGKDKAIEVVLNGLKNLEYRGYDSAGIAYVQGNKIKIKKAQGKLFNLEENFKNKIESNLAIGHTRWATHGEPNQINAHPHRVGNITIVHNGIIENYNELKNKLNYQSKSDTDTEILAAYINDEYQKNKNILEVLKNINKDIIGSYAIGIIVDNDDSLYCIRKDSPLIIGLADNEYFIASDVPAILDYTNEYYILENDEYAKIADQVSVYKNGKVIKKKKNIFEFDMEAAKKNGYEHYMLKEIMEQPTVLYNTLAAYKNSDDLVDLSKYSGIDIVGCGSAYHVGMAVKYIMEEKFNLPVNVEIASEYRYKKVFYTSKHLVIVISQSGETADTLAALMKAKNLGIETLAIVNVVGSTIAREADKVLYIKAGVEKAVATTKAYTCQLLLLLMLCYRNDLKIFDRLNDDVNDILSKIDMFKKISKKIINDKDVFFLGRLDDYSYCLEGSLKLKEISYIHSEAYAAGELKHGTISLIEENTPVISIITNKIIADKTISNIKEVKARGAYNVIITNQKIPNDLADEIIYIDNKKEYVGILVIICLQLLAYYSALELGRDIDMPRNLAKSVTVE